MSDEGSITGWISQLKTGDVDAIQPLWEVYFQRLVGLARQRLQSIPRRAADEEDVALSAFNSFCNGMRLGRFPLLSDRHNLWSLLVAITAHKCIDLVRQENRKKRQTNRNVAPDFDQLISNEPSPEFALYVAEQLEQLLEALDRTGDQDLRRIALAKMEGIPMNDIASELNCVRRTIERKLEIIAVIWERGE
jgi:RNA polymerase sigma factor (sigma-70 family)